MEEGRIYYLQQVRTPRDFSQSIGSWELQKWRSFKLRAHAHSWRGLSREFSTELGHRSAESKLWLTEIMRLRKGQYLFSGSSWSGGWGLQAIFTTGTELGVFTTDLLFLVLLLLLPEKNHWVLNSFFALVTLQDLWDLSSPTGDWTWAMAVKA